VETFEAYERGDFAAARELQGKICEFSSRVYALGGYGPSVVKGIKAGLSLTGITSRALVSPFDGLTAEQATAVERAIEELGLAEFQATVPAV